ncbi:hypothetical protein RJ640_005937 [Escallonia rubra]|uniref:Vesicle-fusing ATPase n=1 Tax=Escallonia rubra TaxID=112253 RepID=A0AA88UE11_9ASTE|nr:hypothetical protein RJ640_005937 [Escallonia rubra]
MREKASKTFGWSGAQLEAAVRTAFVNAMERAAGEGLLFIKEENIIVLQSDFEKVIEQFDNASQKSAVERLEISLDTLAGLSENEQLQKIVEIPIKDLYNIIDMAATGNEEESSGRKEIDLESFMDLIMRTAEQVMMQQIEGFKEYTNVFLLGPTNRLDLVDQALLRPGHLELQLRIDLPDENGRLQILQYSLSKNARKMFCQSRHFSEFLKYCKFAASKTFGWSGAQLEAAVRTAFVNAMERAAGEGLLFIKEENIIVLQSDFEKVIEQFDNASQKSAVERLEISLDTLAGLSENEQLQKIVEIPIKDLYNIIDMAATGNEEESSGRKEIDLESFMDLVTINVKHVRYGGPDR